MKRREFLKNLGIGTAFLGATTTLPILPKKALGKNKMNFVFILVDDLGWADLSCQGSKFYETPNIDKLAKDGIRFTNAYEAAPRCVASRTSIMTGKYHYRPGIKDKQGIKLSEVMMAEAFKEAGYRTFFEGKWHLGGPGREPQDQGFDINIGGCELGHPPSYWYPYKKGNKQIPTLGENGKEGEYLTDRMTDEAIKFLKDMKKNHKDKPFFLFFSHYGVHTPLEGKPDLVEKYKEKLKRMPKQSGPDYIIDYTGKVKMKQDNPVYAAMIESVDESVKRVRKTLKELGYSDNTAIIFTSDNGGLSTTKAYGRRKVATSNLPLRTGKGWIYDGGMREPLIVYWPNVTKAGEVTDKAVVGTDFYPTLLDMAGLPLKPQQHLDGVSFAPVLKGDKTFKRKPIFWYYTFAKMGTGNPSMAAVLDGDYKLVHLMYVNKIELYNIKKDIGEKKDIGDQMPKLRDKMFKMLMDWENEVKPKPMNEKFKRVNQKLLDNLKQGGS